MTLEYEYRQRYLEGKEEGREEGLRKGEETGIAKTRERTIQKLHERGESIQFIADIVELDEEEVKRVIDALKLQCVKTNIVLKSVKHANILSCFTFFLCVK